MTLNLAAAGLESGVYALEIVLDDLRRLTRRFVPEK